MVFPPFSAYGMLCILANPEHPPPAQAYPHPRQNCTPPGPLFHTAMYHRPQQAWPFPVQLFRDSWTGCSAVLGPATHPHPATQTTHNCGTPETTPGGQGYVLLSADPHGLDLGPDTVPTGFKGKHAQATCGIGGRQGYPAQLDCPCVGVGFPASPHWAQTP